MADIRHWLRFLTADGERFGTLDGDFIREWRGDMFAGAQETDRRYPRATTRLLPPCKPGKFLGLWNNSRERAVRENLAPPAHPPYFMKGPNTHAGTGDVIRRPAGYGGQVVFEAELGIVIGRRCAGLSSAEAPEAIFGYTCVNDVTARDLLRQDPAFVHWTRAKGFDGFGIFGPAIAAGLDPSGLRIRAVVAGEERQNYPVSDMFFTPAEVVSLISRDMTLEAGDIIACGTGVGAGPLQDGDEVDIVIDGIGRLANRYAA